MLVMVSNHLSAEMGYLAGRYPGQVGHLLSPTKPVSPARRIPRASASRTTAAKFGFRQDDTGGVVMICTCPTCYMLQLVKSWRPNGWIDKRVPVGLGWQLRASLPHRTLPVPRPRHAVRPGRLALAQRLTPKSKEQYHA